MFLDVVFVVFCCGLTANQPTIYTTVV